MTTTPAVEVELFSVGSCTGPAGVLAPERLAGRAGLAWLRAWWAPVRCPALVALLRHPVHGPVLIDTGYGPAFFRATRSLPERMYRWATPVHYGVADALDRALRVRGVWPDEVQHVVLTHWHADHVAGLMAVPAAQIHSRRAGFDALATLGRVGRVRKAFLRALVPDDLAARARWLEDRPCPLPPRLAPLTGPLAGACGAFDVFGDGSIVAVDLPGHAPGQVGVLVAGGSTSLFFVADACWRLADLDRAGPIPRLARGILWDAAAAERTLAALRALRATDPALPLLPSHCAETLGAWGVDLPDAR